MKHHIFLSYSRKDLDLMRRLRADLQSLGFTVWTDEGIDPGTPLWDEAIENALRDSGCMVVILTPNAINARGLRDEIHYANIHEVRIFPVLAAGDAKTSVPYRLSGTQWTDIRIDYDAGVTQLQNAVNKHITPVGALNLTPASPASTAETPIPVKPQSPQIYLPDLSQILPPPFDGCEIPAGKVTLEPSGYLKKQTTSDVPAFTIAKYPITNAQFAKFIEAGGYKNQDWWTGAGWQNREEENWMQPRYWTDKKWNGADYPVVGVSWYEALAFCTWLNEVASVGAHGNAPVRITLPTEQQWQRAAQGDDNRAYPWGNTFDPSRCNTAESGIGKTTLVTQYPRGASPYGIMDMSGNVWEWCLTSWANGNNDVNGTDVRLVRGGSWYGIPRNARAASRDSNYPHDGFLNLGFRVLAAPIA